MSETSGFPQSFVNEDSRLLKRTRYYLVGLSLIPLLLAAFAYFISSQHVKSVAATLDNGRFLLSLDELLSTVQDAETGQRGYLLTGAKNYLEPYLNARRLLDTRLARLAHSAAPTAVDRERLSQLQDAVGRKMIELQAVIDAYNADGDEAAQAILQTNRGKQQMDRIRVLVGEIKHEQTEAYQADFARQAARQRYITVTLAIAAIASLLMMIFAIRVSNLYVRARDQSETQIRLLNEELESRVRERTAELEARTQELEAHAVKLARSNADLAQFASVASHDLQEPLRMVSSYMGMLKRKYGKTLDENAQTYIQYATNGALRMQTLVNDLLAYSHAGTQAISKQNTPFNRIVEQALENLQVAIKEGGATVTSDHLPSVAVDEVKMTQVIQNLIGNGIKFRKPDVPSEIRISAEKKQGTWVFGVHDNGIGFETKYTDRIFQVFQRLHGVGRYPGNGIGLSICRRIIEHHNGKLWAESTLGEGSTFYFSIPSSKGDKE
jgi:signal transduction histidine kinase